MFTDFLLPTNTQDEATPNNLACMSAYAGVSK